jgi:hypothetical protein
VQLETRPADAQLSLRLLKIKVTEKVLAVDARTFSRFWSGASCFPCAICRQQVHGTCRDFHGTWRCSVWRQIPKNRSRQWTRLLARRALPAYIRGALWDFSPKRSLKTQQKWDFGPKVLAIAFRQRHDAGTGWDGMDSV